MRRRLFIPEISLFFSSAWRIHLTILFHVYNNFLSTLTSHGTLSTLRDYCKTCPAFNPFFTLAPVLTGGHNGSTIRSGFNTGMLKVFQPLSWFQVFMKSSQATERKSSPCREYGVGEKSRLLAFTKAAPWLDTLQRHGFQLNKNFSTMWHFWKFWEVKFMHLKCTPVTEVLSTSWFNFKLMMMSTLRDRQDQKKLSMAGIAGMLFIAAGWNNRILKACQFLCSLKVILEVLPYDFLFLRTEQSFLKFPLNVCSLPPPPHF